MPGSVPPPMPPMPTPPQAPQRSGGGFLKGALATAAGVAGGAILFDQLKNMLGGGSNDTAEASGEQYGPTSSESSDLGTQQASWDGGDSDDSTEI